MTASRENAGFDTTRTKPDWVTGQVAHPRDRTRFTGSVSLQDTECFGGLWGNRTVFASGADLRGLEVHGRTWLVGAKLVDDAAPAVSRLAGAA